jgi:predicted  nucleic acid-binding Zn-ribbon protein
MDLEHEKRLTDVEARSKSNTLRINELKERQDNFDELVSSVKVLAEREVRLEDDVKEIKADVKELTAIPAKRWEAVVTKVITVIAAAVVGFILAKIGM